LYQNKLFSLIYDGYGMTQMIPIINLFCKIIVDENEYMNQDEFRFCVTQIIIGIKFYGKYINNMYYDNIENIINNRQWNYLNNFMEYIGRIFYGHSKNKEKYKEMIKKIVGENIPNPDTFITKLKIYYDKYIEKKYAPDPPGPGFIKAKEEFNSLANKQNDKKI
jgi:uncharacterized short protein YbdD (DUF466 family)